MSQIPSINSPFVPNYPVISQMEDLEGKSTQEIWLIICALANHNSLLLSTVNELNGSIHRKDQEINIVRGELSDMATLKAEVLRLSADNQDLKSEVEKLKKDLALIKEGLSAREIGIQADIAALKSVFPDATKKPFSIQTLANFEKFIENPERATKDSRCPPGATEAWNDMDKIRKDMIVGKLNDLLKKYPSLLFSIKTLKANWKDAHTITSVDASIEHYLGLGNETMVDAIKLCAIFLPSQTV